MVFTEEMLFSADEVFLAEEVLWLLEEEFLDDVFDEDFDDMEDRKETVSKEDFPEAVEKLSSAGRKVISEESFWHAHRTIRKVKKSRYSLFIFTTSFMIYTLTLFLHISTFFARGKALFFKNNMV